MGGKLIDLTGMKFGKLVVICRASNRGCNTYYSCQCDCGNKKEISGKSLRNGESKSCGKCSHFIDLTGRRFGRLEVLYKIPNTFPVYYQCKCDCGEEKKIRGTQENSITCCKICNFAKGTMSYDEFISWGKKLGNNLNRDVPINPMPLTLISPWYWSPNTTIVETVYSN